MESYHKETKLLFELVGQDVEHLVVVVIDDLHDGLDAEFLVDVHFLAIFNVYVQTVGHRRHHENFLRLVAGEVLGLR